MTEATLCTPREGSSLYYSLLWTPEATRRRFLEHLHLIRVLSTSLDDVSEAQVAQNKIHWWHEELRNLMHGQAAHPATRSVQRDQISNAMTAELGKRILASAAEWRLNPPAGETEAEGLLEQDFLARLALLELALDHTPDRLALPMGVAGLARGLGRHEQLLRLPYLLHRGQLVFSTETYQRFGLQAADLAARVRVAGTIEPTDNSASVTQTHDARSQACIALLRQIIDLSQHEIGSALEAIPIRQMLRQPALMPLWRLIVLRERQLRLWQRKPPDLLRERRSLTPVMKLYWAWRHRR